MSDKSKVLVVPGSRYDELKAMLDERRRVILQEVQGRIREVRSDCESVRLRGTGEPSDTAALDFQQDLEFALIQHKADVLEKLNVALARLVEGRYGHCGECGEEIEPARLRALPFADSCFHCADKRERARARHSASHSGPPSPWFKKKKTPD